MRNTAALVIIVAATTALNAAAASQATPPDIEWRLPLTAPALAPTLVPYAAHPAGLAIAAGDTITYVRGNGEIIWTRKLGAPAAAPVTVADLDADGAPEFIAVDAAGMLVCKDAAGADKWRHAESCPGQFKTIAAADVNTAPGLEVLSSYENGWVACFSADGRILWRFYGDRFRTGGGFAIGDGDADGAPEIYYGTDNGHIYGLDGNGRVKWRYWEAAPYGRSGPNLADLDADGRAELLITRSNAGNATCLMALNAADGAHRWRTADMMQSYVSIVTCDLDGDNLLEVFHGDKGNYLYCDNADGSRRWRADLGGRGLYWAPCAGDVDGDGEIELIAGVRDSDPETRACLYIVNARGETEHALPIAGGANASPALADIDGDGELELLVSANSPDEIIALTWHKPGRVAWPSFRGDSRMTAAANIPPGVPRPPQPDAVSGNAALDAPALALGDNTCSLAWNTPAPEEAFAETTTRDGSGVHVTRITDLIPGATQAAVPVRINAPGPVSLTARIWKSGATAPMAVALAQPTAAGACDIAPAVAAAEAAINTGNAAGADTSLLRTRLTTLRAQQDHVQTAKDAEAASQLRRDAQSLATLAAVAADAYARGPRPFLCAADANPWDNDIAIKRYEAGPAIDIDAFQGEFEDAALTLMNIAPTAIDVRCTFAEPANGQAQKPEPELASRVTLRRALPVGTSLHNTVIDALPEMDRSRTLTLPPGEPRQLWLTIDTRGLTAGTHELILHIGTLTEPFALQRIPLRVNIWPIELPQDVYDRINWCGFGPDMSDQAVRDACDHHISVIYGPPLPQVPVDEAGNPAGDVDWASFDKALERVPRHFRMLFSSPPARIWPNAAPAEDAPGHIAGLRTAINAMAQHLQQQGFQWDQWAFYPVDEPWNTGFTLIPYLRKFCQAVKKAEPRALIYTDPTGLFRIEYLEEFKNLIDIWQPEINSLKRDPALAQWFRDNAKTFWAYEAPGCAKDLLPLGHYRAQAWLGWKLGITGAGFWVYRGEDNWWPYPDNEYGVTYPAFGDSVPSRRWQAARDGVEDYRALHLLRAEIQNARANGHIHDADNAQALLDKAVNDLVAWQIGKIDEITKMTRDYEIDYNRLLDCRKQIANQVLQLRQLAQDETPIR